MLKSLSSGAQVLIFILLIFLMAILGELIYVSALSTSVSQEAINDLDLNDPRIILSHALFFQINAFLMAFIIMLWLTGQRFHNLVHIGPVKARHVGFTLLILVAAIFSLPLLELISAPLRTILPADMVQAELAADELSNTLLIQPNGLQFVFSLIVIAVLPAICEELVFRGFLIGKIVESGGSENGAIVMSAAIFAISHFQPLKVLSMFVLGLALGFVYLKFKNIKYSMLLHFLINGVQITIAFLVGSGVLDVEI